MKYFLFIDESGDHGLTMVNPNFPVFLLCGIIISAENYEIIENEVSKLKKSIWGEKDVYFHSKDIRKCENEFKVLFDLEVKKRFYEGLNLILSKNHYSIIASAIRKDEYIKKFGKLSDDVYEIALSFIIERSIFYLDGIKTEKNDLEIIIEKRGRKEDKNLEEHFQRLLSRGTGYVIAERLNNYGLEIFFRGKKDKICGLEVADLIAYPTARYVIEPNRANPAFDVFENKFYTKNGKRYGLKVFP